jgi:capsular polysaccharide biosynthesis protein
MENRLARVLVRHVALPICLRLFHPALAGVPRQLGKMCGFAPLPPRRIILETRQWAAESTQDGRKYTELMPAQTLQRRAPGSFRAVDWRIRNDLRHTNPPLFVATIPGGRVVGPHGSIITSDDTLLSDLSPIWFFKPQQHPLFWRFRLPPTKRLKGTYASLARLSGWNYAHWVLELLPRLGILEKAGIDWRQLDGLILNGPKSGWKCEMLDMLGVPEEKRIFLGPGDHFECETLIAPSYVCTGHGFPSWMVEYLQAAFAAYKSTSDKKTRIYIARGKAAYRQILNEPEVIRLLERYRYQITFCEELSFKKKIELFSSAEAVVAAHGAGLTHLAFCPPRTRVLEIFSPSYVNPSFVELSNAADLDYYYITGQGALPPENRDPHKAEQDITVDLPTLEKALKQFGFD